MTHPQFGWPKKAQTVLIDISADDDLSAVVDIGHYKIAAIHAGTLTSTALGFMVCPTEDGTFYDLYDVGGTIVAVTIASSRVTGITGAAAAALASARYIKLSMGSSEAADRTLTLLLAA